MLELNVDTLDLKILEILKNNARIDCKTVAQKVGFSDRTIARRIKRMEEKGVIKGYQVEIDKELIPSDQLKLTPSLVPEEAIQIKAIEWDSLSSAIREIFGVAGSVILYNIGLAIGRCYGRELLETNKDKQEMSLSFSHLFSTRGWGKLIYGEIDFEKGTGRIVVSNMPFKDQTTKHVVRGIICGFLEGIYSKKVALKEVEDETPRDDMQRFTFELE